MTFQEKMQWILQNGYDVHAIYEHMEGRATLRTIYRWLKGQSVPKQRNVQEAVERLVRRVREEVG